MRYFKSLCLFILTLTSSLSYAESSHVLIGQEQGSEKVLFVLELFGDDLEKVIEISENGEIYLKADTILSLPKQEEFPSLETFGFSFAEDDEDTSELLLARGMRPPPKLPKPSVHTPKPAPPKAKPSKGKDSGKKAPSETPPEVAQEKPSQMGGKKAGKKAQSPVKEENNNKAPEKSELQNKQAKDAKKEIERKIGRQLTEDEEDVFHREISKQGYGYHELVEEGTALFPPKKAPSPPLKKK